MYSVNTDTLNFLRNIEGLTFNAKPDAGGYSIGYGHFIQPNELNLMIGINLLQAENILLSDTQDAINAVNSFVKIPLTGPQLTALVSLAFNIGASDFKTSTLVKLINARSGGDAIYQRWISHYVTSQGKKSTALEARRKKEAAMYVNNSPNFDTGKNIVDLPVGNTLGMIILLFGLGAAFYLANRKSPQR